MLVFTAGFTLMLVEITAPRILGPFFGTSTHVWTNIIGVILAALSIGYYAGGRMADRWPSPVLLCLVVMAGCGLAFLIPFVTPALGTWLFGPGLDPGQARVQMNLGSLLTALCLFFPPALLLAVVPPFTIRCLAEHGRLGRAAGTVYALGTIGSILGTFLPTFLLTPWLGTRGTVLSATGLLFLVSLAGFLVHCCPKKD